LLGTVIDPAGAVVPDAKVTIVNTDTDVHSLTQTNGDGYYMAPFLLPGNYRLTVEHAGFKTMERAAIQLRTNERVRIDIRLDVGSLSERVEVTAESPLLETASAERGQVTGAAALETLPTRANNAWTQVTLTTGVQDGNNPLYARPTDAPFNYSLNGGRVTTFLNEVQVDGEGRDLGHRVVPLEAVAEVKVVTNMYDAQYGHTAGGVLALSTKTGTNRLHGAGFENMTRTGLTANTFSNNYSGVARTLAKQDDYGMELDGPVYLPKIYNGKDRTFFTFSFERWPEQRPGGALTTVPTALERSGDFSQSYLNPTTPYTIYDPLSVQLNPNFNSSQPITLNNLQYIRTPFAGNVVPAAQMNPVGVNVLKFLPLPNQTGNAVTHANNFYSANGNSQNKTYDFLIGRVDHNFNSKWKMYAHYDWKTMGTLNPDGVNGWQTVFDTNILNFNREHGAVLDVVGILNANTILDLKVGTNFVYGGYKLPSAPFDQVTQLGLPAALVNSFDIAGRYPAFSWQNYSGVNSSAGFKPMYNTDVGSVNASLVRTQGAHSLHVGVEFRPQYCGTLAYNNSVGSYSFTRSWTSQSPNVDNSATGNAIASMLLGDLSGATAAHNTGSSISWSYLAGYFQDDWRVNRRLTLNMGLRWDYESPASERWNRQTRGFAFGATSPVQVPGLNLTGGLLFAGVNGQPTGAFNPDHQDWQPRLGVAYKLSEHRPIVFRGGVGRVFLPTSIDGSQEIGSSTPWGATTTATTSTSGGAPLPAATFSNPFPTGLISAPGASQGLATLLGTGISFDNSARHTPMMWDYSGGLEYEIKPGLLLEVAYSGSTTRWLPVSKNLDFLSLSQLALGQPYLNTAVSNPFYGVLPSTTSLGSQATVSRSSLLVPYPQYSGVTETNNSFGYSWYNSAQFRVEHRIKHGLFVQVGYTISKTMEAVSLLNAQDLSLLRQKASFDRPQRFVTSVTYHLPVGPGSGLFNTGLMSHIVGGWDLSMTGIAQSGVPISFSNGNYMLTGSPAITSGQSYTNWFNTSSSLWVPLAQGSLRVIPGVSQNIRAPTAPQFNVGLAREFKIHENQRISFRAMAVNATNTPLFNGPNTDPTSSLFAHITLTQINLPREVFLNIRYSF
jgi:hypothetical protein